MRKTIQLSLVLVLLFFSSQAVAGSGYISVTGEKFVNGVANVATGVVELPKNIILTTQNDGVVYGVTVGVVTGLMHTVARTVIGALDVVTFLVPTQPSIRPNYVWQDFSTETSY
ncbi:MAG: exosortase system-associated protein, TIGR04073 family [Betaproteobacteria bacterium]|nr:exosortase system-associated protein, TIGR04073 family [Betaproteobacteria bacterium]